MKTTDELRYSMAEAHMALFRSLDFAQMLHDGNEKAAQGVFHPPGPPIRHLAARLVEDATELAIAAEALKTSCLAFQSKAE